MYRNKEETKHEYDKEKTKYNKTTTTKRITNDSDDNDKSLRTNQNYQSKARKHCSAKTKERASRRPDARVSYYIILQDDNRNMFFKKMYSSRADGLLEVIVEVLITFLLKRQNCAKQANSCPMMDIIYRW